MAYDAIVIALTAAFILAVVGGLLFWLIRRLLRFRALSRFAAANGMAISFIDPFDLLGLGFAHFIALSRSGGADGSVAFGAGSFFRTAFLGIRIFGRIAGSRLENVLSGTWKGIAVRAADHVHRPLMGLRTFLPIPQSRRYSLAIADLGVALPSITIRPERLGDRLRRDLAFEWEDFNRAFEVRCEDRAFAYGLLDARMMEWMMATGDRYSFEIKADKVLVSCRLLSPDRIPALLDVATGFCGRVPQMLRLRYGRPESAP
jgi:hypothetical protein